MSSEHATRRRWPARLILALVLPACYSSGPSGAAGGAENIYTVQNTGRTKVDLLVVVDNSGSMSQEQASMAAHLGPMLRELLDPADEDGDTRPDALPIEDLHVGIVSTDMGTMGYRMSTCLANPDVGDDGCFQHLPNPAVYGCATEYPTFLTRNEENAADYTSDALAHDFVCIGTLGTAGCGFEQQLEALRRAVLDNQEPGRCNEGFLRDDSVVTLVVITDENDCSVLPEHSEMFDQDRVDLGHLSVRCWLHPDYLRSVEWFRDQLLTIRPNATESVVLGEIVGVSLDPLCQTSGASLEACLGLTAMQEEINPAMPTNLIPSCNTSMGIAFSPRRIVELAKLWHEAGGGTYVGSLCQEDWSESAAGIRQEIVERLHPECLPYELEVEAAEDPLPADPSCAVDCALVELIPADRDCASDPACPPEACPPTTLDEVNRGAAPRCRLPGSDTICEPLLRDLGLVEVPEGYPFRACLVRQDAGTYDGTLRQCVPPADSGGWRYVAPEWTAAPFGVCPMLELPASIRQARDDGAVLRLFCGDFECPFDRQCGPLDHPASSCCAADSTCHRDAATGEGACFGPGG